MAENDYAMVVGINHYRGLDDLEGPENDAEDFAAWLRSPTGGAVPTGHIALLTGSRLNGGTPVPNMDQIDSAFERLHTGLDTNGTTGRRLYIFLAGHGFDREGDDAALLCATATRRRLGDHISGKRYWQWFLAAALFDEVAIFMDTCRDAYPQIPFRDAPWTKEIRPKPGIRRCRGFATRWGYQSRERPDPDDPSLRVRGLFSKALVETLGSGRLTGEQVKAFTINRLRELVPGDEYQEPDIEVDDGLVFGEAAGPPTGRLVITATHPRRGHVFRLNGPNGERLGTERLDAAPWEPPPLAFAQYALTDEDTGEMRFVEILKARVDVAF